MITARMVCVFFSYVFLEEMPICSFLVVYSGKFSFFGFLQRWKGRGRKKKSEVQCSVTVQSVSQAITAATGKASGLKSKRLGLILGHYCDTHAYTVLRTFSQFPYRRSFPCGSSKHQSSQLHPVKHQWKTGKSECWAMPALVEPRDNPRYIKVGTGTGLDAGRR
jgi:hypothetical protein